MLNPQHNSYYRHYDLLTSLITKQVKEHSELYFVTIQPTEQLFTQQQAEQYINNLFPMGLNAIVQLERNDKVSQLGRYKSYDLLPTLHIHLITTKQYLINLNAEVCYYTFNYELKEKKKKAKYNHYITACPLFNTEGLVKYLTKQYCQYLTPFVFKVFAPIYNEMGETKKEKKPINVISQVNALSLLQLLCYGFTYAEVKQQRHNVNKELLNKSILYTKALPLLTNDDFIYLINQINPHIKAVQVKPNPPNRLTNANLC